MIELHHKLDDISVEPPELGRDALPRFTEPELLQVLEHVEQPLDKSGEVAGNEQELEHGRKRIQLEKTIQMLEKQLEKEGEKRYKMAERISKEGAILTVEYNSLSSEKKSITERTVKLGAAHKLGMSLSSFIMKEIQGKTLKEIVTPVINGGIIKNTTMPLPPI
jgi:vacuolar-type H+-ATPase subunit I/STV1